MGGGGGHSIKTTCMVSGADPGLDPQGALLQPMACTHELERSKPWRACAKVKGHEGKRGSKGNKASSTGEGGKEGRNNDRLKEVQKIGLQVDAKGPENRSVNLR